MIVEKCDSKHITSSEPVLITGNVKLVNILGYMLKIQYPCDGTSKSSAIQNNNNNINAKHGIDSINCSMRNNNNNSNDTEYDEKK